MIIKLNLAAPSIHLRQPITTNDHPVLIENDNNSELDPPHNLWGKTPSSIFHNAIQFWFEWLLSPHTNIQIKHLINFCICLGSNPLSLENISLFCNMLMALEMSRKHGRKSLSAQLRAPVRGYWDTLGHVVTIHFICWMGWLQGMSHAAGESFIVQSDYSNTLGSSNRVWRCALSHYLWSLTQYRSLSLFKVMNVRYPFCSL